MSITTIPNRQQAVMPTTEVLAEVVLNGDLARLTPEQKVAHYNAVCNSVGLNPLTKPFDYMRLNGKELLYAKKDCSDQLRKIHDVTLTILEKRLDDDLFLVTVRATLPSGRTDEDLGAVTIGNLKGENRANAMLKAITKAKRRVTMSICGLGWLDETEASDIPSAEAVPQRQVLRPQSQPVNITPAARAIGMDATLDGDNIPDHQPPSFAERVERVIRAATGADTPDRLARIQKQAGPLLDELEQAGALELRDRLVEEFGTASAALQRPADDGFPEGIA